MTPDLPVRAILPDLLNALAANRAAVLAAPPGAGKTTRVPLALCKAPWRGDRRLVVVEPRRIAARAAAGFMAATLAEQVGRTVGYQVRLENRSSPETAVKLVTPGVFLSTILDDPALEGVAAVVFDEVHERSVQMDLAMTLTLDAQAGLREDLKLLAMSATLDTARFAAFLGGVPVIESQGRMFPVDCRYLGRPAGNRIEAAVADAVRRALREEEGSVLAFLPGQAEILRTAALLDGNLPGGVDLAPLYGALDARRQDAAIAPAGPGHRKVVLASAVAQTSLTIEGVRIVIDSGLDRRPRFDPATGLSRLETVRVSRATADQRRGRAGRTDAGICYRLWDEPETAGLPPQDPPEILETDLADLTMALAGWGVAAPERLEWLDPPPRAAFSQSRALLRGLGALGEDGSLTGHGRSLLELPLSPRLAHMVRLAGREDRGPVAAQSALLISERGVGGRSADLRDRLRRLHDEKSGFATRVKRLARRWGGNGDVNVEEAGACIARAFPDRIAMARGETGRFLMANGRGAWIDPADPLARESFLAIAEVAGAGRESRILLAAPVDRETIEAVCSDRIEETAALRYDAAAGRIVSQRERRLGSLSISPPVPVSPDPETAADLLLRILLDQGLDRLPWTPAARRLRARIDFARRTGNTALPDMSDGSLAKEAGTWLRPALLGATRVADVTGPILEKAFETMIPGRAAADLNRWAPETLGLPSGRTAPIDYEGEKAVLRVRVQELFGLNEHPRVGPRRLPLTLELLSPARRPIQVTTDLPGFWSGSWKAVRSEMRGRYPKHAWPDDPASATPPGRKGRP